MFGLNLIPWAIAAFLALGVGLYVVHCEKVKGEQARFVAELRQQAQEQERRNKDRADKEKAAKEKADEQVKNERNSLLHTIKRLRDSARSGPSLVPAASSCAGDISTAAFDRAELDRALRNFTAGVSELIGEGEQAAIELNGARRWALELKLATELIGGQGDKKD